MLNVKNKIKIWVKKTMMIEWNLFEPAVLAFFMAAFYAISVYYSKTNEDKWSYIKAGKTSILAGVVAFVGTYQGISADIIIASPFYAFLGIVIERVLKIFKRRIVPMVNKIINK